MTIRASLASHLSDEQPMPDRAVWMHDGQIDFSLLTYRTKVLIAGRGWGKSTYIALQMALYVQEMPGSRGALIALSETQLKNETMEAVCQMWQIMGLVENIHYVLYQEPPESWKSKQIAKVKKWDNVISFCNGTVVSLYSANNYKTARGANLHWCILDEAGFFKRDVYHDVISKGVRCMKGNFKSPYLHQKVIVSSPPRESMGLWVTDFKTTAKQRPNLIHYDKRPATENPYLSDEWHDEQQTASPMAYAIEVLCQDGVVDPELSFYFKYDTTKHEYLTQYEWRFGRHKDTLYNPNAPLHLTWDFGTYFSCASLLQPYQEATKRYVVPVLCQFFTQRREKYPQVVEKFALKYSDHHHKVMYLYGDPNGRYATPQSHDDYYTDIAKLLKSHGWTVHIVVERGKQAENHIQRRKDMNAILSELDPALPVLRINKDHAADVSVAMCVTNTLPNGKKDKGLEADKQGSQLHAPHFTDGLDYFFEQWANGKGVLKRQHKTWG